MGPRAIDRGHLRPAGLVGEVRRDLVRPELGAGAFALGIRLEPAFGGLHAERRAALKARVVRRGHPPKRQGDAPGPIVVMHILAGPAETDGPVPVHLRSRHGGHNGAQVAVLDQGLRSLGLGLACDIGFLAGLVERGDGDAF